METVTGLPYVTGPIIFGAILLVYTVLGGTKGTVAVSIFQGFVMTVTTVALAIGIYVAVRNEWGSVQAGFQNLAQTSPSHLTPTASFGYLGLASFLFLTGVSGNIGANNVAQATKIGTSKNLHNTTALSLAFVCFWSMVMPTLGTIGRTIFPDVLSDSIIPFSSLVVLPPIFAGIVVAGVTAAIHSTLAFQLININ